MAKTIKFNLILDNKSVRTIEDLRENFSIEDILELYNNGLLQKWLDVRGYSALLEKVNSIEVNSNFEQVQELIKIFGVECDAIKIKEGIAILDYSIERKCLLEQYSKMDCKAKAVIDDYHSGYDSIINDIIENKDNMPRIKASIKEIEENYIGLFNLNYRDLYNNLIVKAPLAIFAILMNTKMRDYFISSDNSSKNTYLIYSKIVDFVANKTSLKGKLGEELKIFKGNTEAYWKDIEPKGKSFMIVSMKDGNYVRNAGMFGEELASCDVNSNFMILDGIDYKSNNEYHELLYMEV
ncbi:MAG: hypothetical protein ACRCW0_04755 [Clostridium sp.]